MCPKRNVHAYRIAFPYELSLKVAADAVKHLEFNRLFGQTNLLGILLGKNNPLIIM